MLASFLSNTSHFNHLLPQLDESGSRKVISNTHSAWFEIFKNIDKFLRDLVHLTFSINKNSLLGYCISSPTAL